MSVQNFTVILYVISAAIFFIPGLCLAKNRWRTILDAVAAVGVAVALNASTLAAIYELHNEHLVMPYKVTDLLGSASRLSLGNMTRLDLGLILSAMILFQLVFAALNWKRLKIVEKLINLDGFCFCGYLHHFFHGTFLLTILMFFKRFSFRNASTQSP